jgi:uncharacterized protein (DUF58 family)
VISREIFKKVRQLEIRTRGLVNNLFGGEYHSAFKGRGMVFSEVRSYQYGDDIRSIDWNVTARTGTPFIKVFEEEREQTLMLCVDLSRSGLFGSGTQRKQDLITELCAVLAFSAIKNNDKVGMILFTDRIEKVVLPRKGKTHVLRMIRDLYAFEPVGKGTDLAAPLDLVNRILRRRSIVAFITDFQASGYEKALKITNRKHDLVALQIADQFEKDLPDVGLITLRDAETGRSVLVDTSSKKVRSAIRKQQMDMEQALDTLFLKNKMDAIRIYTNQSYIEPLMNFFKRRGQRY